MSAVPSVTADLAASLEARLARFPAQQAVTAAGQTVGYREAGAGALVNHDALPLVLLHGIGSGAASWVQQFEALGGTRRVLAWDAPGYGASTPVVPASPNATDYAEVLRGWLDALGIERCVLVGHSLGAIIAGAFAAANPQCVAGLLLLSPAGGYGAAAADVRESKRDQRLAMLAELGPQGLAEKRSANMLSRHADDDGACLGALEHGAHRAARLCPGDAPARQRRSRRRPHPLPRPHQRGGGCRRHHHAAVGLRAIGSGRPHTAAGRAVRRPRWLYRSR